MNQKIKLAIVTTMAESPWGGSEELWGATAAVALKEGHEVMALVPAWNPRHAKVQSLADSGMKVAEWGELNASVESNAQAGRSAWYPYQSILEFAPDIVFISHGGLLDCVNGHLLLVHMLLENNIRFIMIIQANTDLYFPNDFQRRVLQAYLTRAEKVFFAARQNLETARRQLAIPLENGDVFYSPLKLGRYDYVPWPASDTALLASVARLDALPKGQDLLLEILSRDKWRQRDWKLRLFGEGIHENYFRELIHYYRLEDKVEISGKNRDMWQIWSEHQLLVLPSRLEGTPIVLFGAMLCGRPAVVTDVGGNADWIADGENGFVAPAATIPILDEALERAWGKRHLWSLMGQKGRDYFLEHHEIHTEIAFFSHLKRAVVGTRASAVPERKKVPLVTVIIPCYNYGHYLTAAVVSVVNQTFQDFELIIVDDGSTDDSVTVAQRLITQHPQHAIRLITIANSGTGNPAFPRNRGVRESRGEYLLFLDADDMIMPTMLEECLGLLQEHPEISIAYTDHMYFDDKAHWPVVTPDYDFRRLLVNNHLAYCALFRRKAWDDAGGVPTDVGYEDWDFWITCGTKGHFARRIPKPLFCYRQHEEGRFKKELIVRDTLLKAQIICKHGEYFNQETVDAACKTLLSTDGKWLPNVI